MRTVQADFNVFEVLEALPYCRLERRFRHRERRDDAIASDVFSRQASLSGLALCRSYGGVLLTARLGNNGIWQVRRHGRKHFHPILRLESFAIHSVDQLTCSPEMPSLLG